MKDIVADVFPMTRRKEAVSNSAPGERVLQRYRITFSNPDSRYQVMTTKGLADIIYIDFWTEIWCSEEQIPISKITSYKNSDVELLQSVQLKLNVDENLIELNLVHNQAEKLTIQMNKEIK